MYIVITWPPENFLSHGTWLEVVGAVFVEKHGYCDSELELQHLWKLNFMYPCLFDIKILLTNTFSGK